MKKLEGRPLERALSLSDECSTQGSLPESACSSNSGFSFNSAANNRLPVSEISIELGIDEDSVIDALNEIIAVI